MSFSNQLRPGSLLYHGTYRIERVLGQGGYGITYLATDINLRRPVAIKEFFPKEYCDRQEITSRMFVGSSGSRALVERLKAKFLKEARNIARFDHPGIIKIHACFEENDTAYYVMDYIEGQSLSEIVKSSGPLTPQAALRYVEQVGDALVYLHAHRFNHFDVKPANIMVNARDKKAVLIDFGLSKEYDSSGHQTSSTPIGISHGFAPIEQYNDDGVSRFSPQSDLYSLAATLYFLLTARVPTYATRMVSEGLNFPPGFPPTLIAPIRKAMAPDANNRHESVRQFLNVLQGADNAYDPDGTVPVDRPRQRLQASRRSRGQDLNVPNRQPRPRRKNYLWLYLLVFFVVVGAAVTAILILLDQPKDDYGKEEAVVEANSPRAIVDVLIDLLFEFQITTDDAGKREILFKVKKLEEKTKNFTQEEKREYETYCNERMKEARVQEAAMAYRIWCDNYFRKRNAQKTPVAEANNTLN